jgi:hypothetical protein
MDTHRVTRNSQNKELCASQYPLANEFNWTRSVWYLYGKRSRLMTIIFTDSCTSSHPTGYNNDHPVTTVIEIMCVLSSCPIAKKMSPTLCHSRWIWYRNLWCLSPKEGNYKKRLSSLKDINADCFHLVSHTLISPRIWNTNFWMSESLRSTFPRIEERRSS